MEADSEERDSEGDDEPGDAEDEAAEEEEIKGHPTQNPRMNKCMNIHEYKKVDSNDITPTKIASGNAA
ncbi:MAG TPA: hypothetical protein V6C97_00895 [Oculatellaceae cyanobacterium]